MKTRWCCPPTSQTTSSCAKATAATAHCRAGAHPQVWPHNMHVTIVLGGQARKNTQKPKHPSNALKRFPIADKPLKKSKPTKGLALDSNAATVSTPPCPSTLAYPQLRLSSLPCQSTQIPSLNQDRLSQLLHSASTAASAPAPAPVLVTPFCQSLKLGQTTGSPLHWAAIPDRMQLHSQLQGCERQRAKKKNGA